MSLTVSYAQQSDSVRCYNQTDLRKIATKLTQGEECGSLLDIVNNQLILSDSLNKVYFQEIGNYKKTVVLKDTIIYNKDLQIANLEQNLRTTKKHWFLSTCVFVLFSGLFILR